MKAIWNTTTEELRQSMVIDDNAKVPKDWTDKKPLWVRYEEWDGTNWVENTMLKVRTEKSKEIKEYFDNSIKQGSFTSIALGIEVDCRRDIMKNDLQNVQGLISYMKRNAIETVDYVGYSEIKTGATIEMLTSLCAEMEDYVLGLYQKKWTLQAMVDSATTEEEIELIKWEE